MGILATVEEKLESEAEFGLFIANFKIGKVKAQSLRDQGCIVTDSKEVNYFPRLHRISWKSAKVECNNIQELDEKSETYTLAQKLWIISMKNQPKCTK